MDKNNLKKGRGGGAANNPTGRPKGVPNKTTMLAREAIARFVDGNMERVLSWIEQIEDPKDRVKCVTDLLEYHVPKLARTESETKISGNLTFGWVNADNPHTANE